MKHIFFVLSMITIVAQATIMEIEGQDALDAALTQNKNVVLKFYRPGCPACKDIDASYKRVSDMIPNVTFAAVDTSKAANKSVFPQWGVKGVPTIFFVKNKDEKTEYKRDRNFASSFEKAVKNHFGK